jgi:pimeloyl-ACP methyl ester carboxylesterase
MALANAVVLERRRSMRAGFERVDGRLMRYLVAGSGPALLLIHPVGYPADVFARNFEALAEAFTVVAPDLPGQGFSEAPASWDPAPQRLMMRSVLALADRIGLGRFHLAGSSLGGLIAALIALHHGDRVLSLTITGSGSVFNEPSGQPAVLEQVFRNGSSAYLEPSLERCRARLANTCHVAPPAEDILLTQITAYAWPGALEAYRSIIQGLAATIADPQHSVYPHLEQIRVPSLVIVGAEDKRTSAQSHAAGVQRMADARMLVYPGCGHLPFLEQPERFNRDLLDFAGNADGARP